MILLHVQVGRIAVDWMNRSTQVIYIFFIFMHIVEMKITFPYWYLFTCSDVWFHLENFQTFILGPWSLLQMRNISSRQI